MGFLLYVTRTFHCYLKFLLAVGMDFALALGMGGKEGGGLAVVAVVEGVKSGA